MTHHTIQASGSLSQLANISDAATAFANGDTVNTNGKAFLVDINGAIFGAYNVDGPDGYALNNSVYQPADGDIEIAPNVQVSCRGNVNTRNIKFRGGNGSRFEVVSGAGETRTFTLGDSETGVFVESLATDVSSPFEVCHSGDGVGLFVSRSGANFLGLYGKFAGWGDGSSEILFSIENSEEKSFLFDWWHFSNKAPIKFSYTGLEGLSPVDVGNTYFERSDDPNHDTLTTLILACAQTKVTQSTVQPRNWSNCTVNGIAEVFFPGGYTLDNWIVRDLRMSSDSDRNAESMNGLVILGLTADIFSMSGVSGGFIYMTSDNPHGPIMARLKENVVYRNMWIQSKPLASPNPADNDDGDAMLVGAGNSLTDYLNSIQIDIENCGFLTDDGLASLGIIGLTINGNTTEGGGDLANTPRINLRHCLFDLNWGANGINADEVGPTPGGIVGDILNNIFWSSRLDGGYVLQTFNDSNPNPDIADGVVDYNARFGLSQAYEGVYSNPPGVHDLVGVDPQFVNPLARIETFDASLGGPGTLDNAVAEFLKANTPDYNPDYSASKLVQYFQDAFTAQATAYQTASDIGGLVGPTLGGGGVTIVSVNDGAPIKHLQIGVLIKTSVPVEAGTFNAVRCTGINGNTTIIPVTQIDATTFLMDYRKGPTNLGFTAGGLELIRI